MLHWLKRFWLKPVVVIDRGITNKGKLKVRHWHWLYWKLVNRQMLCYTGDITASKLIHLPKFKHGMKKMSLVKKVWMSGQIPRYLLRKFVEESQFVYLLLFILSYSCTKQNGILRQDTDSFFSCSSWRSLRKLTETLPFPQKSDLFSNRQFLISSAADGTNSNKNRKWWY